MLASRDTCDVPQRWYPLDLRQDIYKDWQNPVINVTDVKVTAFRGGGLWANIQFEPVQDTVRAHLVYHFCNKSRCGYIKKVLSVRGTLESRFVSILPGQTSVDIALDDAYDQFSLVAITDGLPKYDYGWKSKWAEHNNKSIERTCLGMSMARPEYRSTIDVTKLPLFNRSSFWQRFLYNEAAALRFWVWASVICILIGAIVGIVFLSNRK